MYLAEHADDPLLREALDPRGTAAPDALVICPNGEALYGSPFNATRMVSWIRDAVEEGLRAGYAAVRLCEEIIVTAGMLPY